MLGFGQSFSKYDVLVAPPSPGLSTEYSLTKHQDHVGNQRFQVLLNMNQESYRNSQKRGAVDECNQTVDTLVDTVCNQVVPRGRFLVSSSFVVGNAMPTLQWNPMDDQVVKDLLHKVLKSTEPMANTVLSSSSSCDGNTCSSIAAAAASVKFSLENNEALDVEPARAFPPPLGQQRNDDGQKRRRRSSLLRRSNSESMVGLMLDNRKKLNHDAIGLRGRTQEEPTSWKSASSVGELNRMDVVLSPARDALDPSCMSVGNNRLHILIVMKSGLFRGGSIDQQEKILDETVETVYTFWKGRFLVEMQGCYEELPKGEAREAMRIILAGKTKDEGKSPHAARRQRHSDPVGGAASFGLFNTFAGNFDGPAVVRSSLPASYAASLPSTLMEDARKNQNLALENLKKQQTRNQNANRLKETLGVTTTKSYNSQQNTSAELPLFPIGGMMQPSLLGTGSGGNNNFGPMNGGFSSSHRTGSSRSSFRPRESTVFSKVDPSVMEQLVASLDDADCNDDMDDPLPLSNPSSFGNQFNGGAPGSGYYSNNGNGDRHNNGQNSRGGMNSWL